MDALFMLFMAVMDLLRELICNSGYMVAVG